MRREEKNKSPPPPPLLFACLSVCGFLLVYAGESERKQERRNGEEAHRDAGK